MKNNSRAQELSLTLGPSGFVLGCSPALKQLFGLASDERLTFTRLSTLIQPQASFLTLINNLGSGIFTIASGLYEIAATKDAQTGQTHLQMSLIEDDQALPGTRQNSIPVFPNGFEVASLLPKLLKKIPAASAGFLLEFDEVRGHFQVVYSLGYVQPTELQQVFFGKYSQYCACLQVGAPQHITTLKFFQGMALDGGSLFGYRAATGGKLALCAITLPLAKEDGRKFVLAIENDLDAAAFAQVDLVGLDAWVRSQIPADPTPNLPAVEPLAVQLQALDTVLAMLHQHGNGLPPAAELLAHLQFITGKRGGLVWETGKEPNIYTQIYPVSADGHPIVKTIDSLSIGKPTLLKELASTHPACDILTEASRSAILVPVEKIDGTRVLVCLCSDQPQAFSAADVNAVSIYQRQVSSLGGNPLNPTDLQNQKRISQSNAIWEALVDGVLVTDSINRVVFSNRSLAKYLDPSPGLTDEATIETAARQMQGNLARWKETIIAWSVNPEGVQPGDVFEEQVKLSSGRVVAIHLSPVVWGREFLGTVTVFRDISYEFEFDRLKTDFITSISHELRTPLTSIQGYVDLLLMGVTGDLNDEQRNFMMIVKNNSERLNNLINDMLELTTIEAGKANLSIHPTDIFTLASEVLERYRERSEKENKQVEFSLECEPSIPLAMADPERARQIFDNLLSNAYTYTQSEGKIVISLKKAERSLQVNISDTGIGIGKEHKEVIFDQFSWVDHSAEHGKGIGLGLPIVKQLVELQNGKIWVESSGVPGEGSTFSFTLPLKG